MRLAAAARHSTREEIVSFTREALEIADELELDPSDRAILLPVLLSLVQQRQLHFELVQPGAGLDLGRLVG